MREPSQEGISHRPLPSVGIPLLRGELRASRLRKLIALGVGVFLVIGGVVSAIFLPEIRSWIGGAPRATQRPEAPSEAVAEPVVAAAEPAAPREEAPVEEPLADGDGTRTTRRFGSARAFRPGLMAAGLSGGDADAVIGALDDVMDFRRCRPEHEMIVERARDGRLRRFEYRASVTQIYEAFRNDEGTIVGRQVEVPVERIRLRRGGTVSTSLGSALEAAGLGRSLVGVFVDIFERNVNFSSDTRAGDTFRIIVDEERINGQFLRYGTVHAVEVRGGRIGQHQAFWFRPNDELEDFFDPTGRAMHGGWLRTPLRYDHISSPFDPRRRHPILRRIMPHNGIDYSAPPGTPVFAAAHGVIAFVGPRGPNGNLVSIRHDNGFETHYAHLSRFAPGLATGANVRQRQLIGYVGSTGRSTGPHLHFGLKRSARFIDPMTELNGPGRMLPSSYLGRYRRQAHNLAQELSHIPIAPPSANERPEPQPTAAID